MRKREPHGKGPFGKPVFGNWDTVFSYSNNMMCMVRPHLQSHLSSPRTLNPAVEDMWTSAP